MSRYWQLSRFLTKFCECDDKTNGLYPTFCPLKPDYTACMNTKMQAFSLIELMTVLAIIALLGTIAWPGYQGYMEGAHAARVRADVQSCALRLERFHANNFTYAGGAAGCTLWSPGDGPRASARYLLSVDPANSSTFTLRAEPVSGDCDGRCYELDADGAERHE